jgi:hypothetical protein
MKPALEQNAKSPLIQLLFVLSAQVLDAKMATIQKCVWYVKGVVKLNRLFAQLLVR